MKTLLQINTEISALTESLPTLKRNQLARAKNRILLLKDILRYIEGMPEEGFVKNEIKRLENRINRFLNEFNPKDYKDPKAALKKYEADMGIPKLRKQIRVLRFILN